MLLAVKENVWNAKVNSKIEYGVGPYLRKENTINRKYKRMHMSSLKIA